VNDGRIVASVLSGTVGRKAKAKGAIVFQAGKQHVYSQYGKCMAIELEPKPALCHCHGITEQIEQREGPAICAFVTWRYSIFGLAEDYKTLLFSVTGIHF
jgi:hypothetical protein